MYKEKLAKAIRRPDLILPALRRSVKRLAPGIGSGGFAWNPEIIYVIVNNSCNGRCIMCDIGQANRNSSHYQNLIAGKEDLRLEDFKKLISGVSSFKPEICFNGVEPLLHPGIGQLVAIAREAGSRAVLTTNGSLLEKRAEELVKAGIDEIVVSLDGLQKGHDAIRGLGMYQAAVDGIQRVLNCREFGGTRKPVVKVNYCISGCNCDGLAEFADWMFDRVGVDVVGFTHLNFVTEEMSGLHNRQFADTFPATPISTGVDPGQVDIEVLWRQLLEIYRRFDPARVIFDVRYKEQEKLAAHYGNPTDFSGRRPCPEPWISATMRANGDFLIRSRCVPCIVGNIREQTFDQIWQSEMYRAFRQTLKKAKFFPVCARCCGTL